MKITASSSLATIPEADIRRFVTTCLQQVTFLVNGNLSFADNMKSQLISATFAAANVTTVFEHQLNLVPLGYLSIGSDVAMTLYDGASPNTDSKLFLKSTAVGVARVLVFV